MQFLSFVRSRMKCHFCRILSITVADLEFNLTRDDKSRSAARHVENARIGAETTDEQEPHGAIGNFDPASLTNAV
jgi:hypothetical protein